MGINISAVDYEAAVDGIIRAAQQRRPMGVSALAVHGVMTGVLDRDHCFRLNQLEMLDPDGQPVRWAVNLLYGVKLPDRVYGPNLTLKVCQAAAQANLSIFLFGGPQSMLDLLQTRLKEQFPQLRIAGAKPSKFRTLNSEERDELVEEIQDSGADITLVGIGCPRQEVWAFEFREALSMPVLAVGAAFAFHSGQLDQAPAWMQRAGLEWLYRLSKEPQRLWKRYAITNPAFVSLFLLQFTKLWTLQPTRGTPPDKEILYG